MITTLEEKTVVARKRHTCQLCVRWIEKGESHYTQRNADSGEIWTWRAHTKCKRLMPAYWKHLGYEPHEMVDDEVIDGLEFRRFLEDRHNASSDETKET